MFEPQRLFQLQRLGSKAQVNFEGTTELARSGSNAVRFWLFLAIDPGWNYFKLECPDQDSAGHSIQVGDNIQAVIHSL